MFYGDCMKVCEDVAPNFGNKRTGCCIMTTHHLTLSFLPGLDLAPLAFLCFPVKIKLRGPKFVTVEVIEAKSQSVLITLIKHDFQDALKKKDRSTGNGAYMWKGTVSRVMVVSRPEVSFEQMAASVPEIMDIICLRK
jgi:hypothetical protein